MNPDPSLARGHYDCAAVERLVLARLLIPAKRPPTPASVKKQLAPFFLHRLSTAEWNDVFESAVASLSENGLATSRPLALTDTGRTRALESLGMQQVPPRLTWATLKAAWLTPLALNAPIAGSRDRDRLKSADGFKGYVLKREYGLPIDKCPTFKESLDALIWKQLGIETDRTVTRDALLEEVVGRMLDPSGRLKKKQVQDQLPAKALGASQTSAEELRLAAIRRWIEQDAVSSTEKRAPSSSEQGLFDDGSFEKRSADEVPSFAANGDDLARFAEQVRTAARSSIAGRFGPNKVFIGQVWRQLETQPAFLQMNLAAFKSRLVEANRAGLVSLSRADLVEAMNPHDVATSETRHLNAVFHFVTLLPE
jgi:hypothetical protein